MIRILGLSVQIFALLGGLAFWGYTFFVWGVFRIIQATTNIAESLSMNNAVSTADEISLTWGIAWLFLSTVITVCIVVIGFFANNFVYSIKNDGKKISFGTSGNH